MCLPAKNANPDAQTSKTSKVARTTTLSTIVAGAGMMLACAAGPALIGAVAGGLAVGTLGLAAGAVVIALCLTVPLFLRARRARADQGCSSDCSCQTDRHTTAATA